MGRAGEWEGAAKSGKVRRRLRRRKGLEKENEEAEEQERKSESISEQERREEAVNRKVRR